MMKKLILILSCLFLSIGLVYSQTITVNGVVVDDAGIEVIGASVVVKGTTTGVATDIDGKFSLNVPSNSTLVFSLVGMKKVEMKASPSMKVVMANDDALLEEVIVVAYGTAKKSQFTGSAGVMSAKNIGKLQVSSVSKALEGAIPGLQAASDGGQPGSDATLRVRGYGSMSAGNSPLIVVDGIVYDGNLNSINSKDIESISVLKDAASAALYGSRAANGVIMITTKKGALGKTQVSVDVRQGINVRGIPTYDVMKDEGQYLETAWGALYQGSLITGKTTDAEARAHATDKLYTHVGYNPYKNVGNNEMVGTDGKLANDAQLRYRDRWIDEAFKTGYRQEYNVSVSSGNEKSSSYLSFGFLDDKGIIEKTGFQRFSVRENVAYKVNENLKLNGNLSYSRTTQDLILAATNTGAASNMFAFVSNIAPIYPVYAYDEDGQRMYDTNGRVIYDYGDKTMPGVLARPYSSNTNPIGQANLDKNKNTDDSFNGRGSVDYSFLEYFKATVNLGYDLRNNYTDRMYNKDFGDAVGIGGRVQKYGRRYQTLSVNQLLNYNQTFAENHNVGVLIGHESYEHQMRYLYGEKTGMLQDDVDEFNNAIIPSALDSYSRKKSMESYLGQVLYDYANKYYFSGSFRRDGSSKFHKDNRWGNFGSIGASWRISEESFIKDNYSWIDNLRLKTSYGWQGNDVILDQDGYEVYTPYEDHYEVVNVDGVIGAIPNYVGNRDLKWETNKMFNIGLDFGLFSRLTVEFDFYVRTANDLLFNMPVPTSEGYRSYPDNLADSKNTGIEFTIAGDIIRTKDFRWNMSLIGAYNKNKITSIPSRVIDTSANRVWEKGGTILDFFLLDYVGVDSETGKEMYSCVDEKTGEFVGLTDDPNVAANYRKNMGSALPDFTGGVNWTFEYKNFDLAIMTNFQFGGKVLDRSYRSLMNGGNTKGSNWHKDMLRAWTPDNPNTDVPRMDSNSQNIAPTNSSRFLIGADYFSLRNITLGYTFPKTALEVLRLSDFRVSFTGDNIALVSKRKGLDPRQALSSGVTGRSVATGRSDYGYTPVRSFSLGISANF